MIASPDKMMMDRIVREDEAHVSLRRHSICTGSGWYLQVKVLIDLFFAAVLLVLSLPLILTAALLVKLSSKGPAFFTQKRVGRNGRIYTIYKLRTMHHNCEKHSGPQWSTAGDTRITPVGRLLRRSHIDELPQLWNVLK